MAYRAVGGAGYDAYSDFASRAMLTGLPTESGLGLAVSASDALAVVAAPGNLSALGRVYIYRCARGELHVL